MNKVFLIGNLTRDPELSATSSGINVCRFSIAVQRKFSSQSGERETDFFNITAWRGLADNCHKYLRKGSKVSIVGSVQIRQYDGNDGTKKTAVDIVAEDVEFLTPKSADASSDYDAVEAAPKGKAKKAKSIAELEPVDDDENLPF